MKTIKNLVALIALFSLTISSAQNVTVVKNTAQSDQVIQVPYNDLLVASFKVQPDTDVTLINVTIVVTQNTAMAAQTKNYKLFYSGYQIGSTQQINAQQVTFSIILFPVYKGSNGVFDVRADYDTLGGAPQMGARITFGVMIDGNNNFTGSTFTTPELSLQSLFWKTSTTPTTSVDVAVEDAGIQVYPNPCTNQFTVPADYTSLVVYNMNGQLVYTANGEEIIQTSDWKPGVYLVNIDGRRAKIVKN